MMRVLKRLFFGFLMIVGLVVDAIIILPVYSVRWMFTGRSVGLPPISAWAVDRDWETKKQSL